MPRKCSGKGTPEMKRNDAAGAAVLLLSGVFTLSSLYAGGNMDGETVSVPRFWDNGPEVLVNSGAVKDELLHADLRLEARRCYRRFGEIPCGSKEEWEHLKKDLRRKLWRQFGVEYDAGIPLCYQEYGTIPMNGYSIRKITYQSRKGMLVTGNLYIPDGEGPFPAVLNMHGHYFNGKAGSGPQKRGAILAECGYVCLTIDAFGAGERTNIHGTYLYHGGNLGASLLNIGESLMGCQVVDNMRAVDLLCSLPMVDPKRIGATGASGGGNQTMWLTAMDDRVQAAIPMLSVGTFESYLHACNCVCEVLTGGLTFTEESRILALAAPRAVKIFTGFYDGNPAFQPKEMLRSFEKAEPVFRLFGKPGNLAFQIFNVHHGYIDLMGETMIGWFDLHLKRKGHGEPVPYGSVRLLTDSELNVFPPGKRPGNVRSIASHCTRRGEELRSRMFAWKSIHSAEKVSALKHLLALDSPPALCSAEELKRRGPWRRFVLTLTGGRQIPLAILERPGKTIRLMVHPEGKQKLPYLPPDDSPAVADLYGHGENQAVPDKPDKPYFDTARWQIWLGRNIIGIWTGEIGAVCDFLKKEFPHREITVHGFREAGVAALAASIFKDNISEIIYEDAPCSYLYKGDDPPSYYSQAVHIPGFLNWGDISLAMALSRAKVKILSPRDMSGKKVNSGVLPEERKKLAALLDPSA